jgi:coenzyme Q-binding protein COQ10
MVIEKVGELLPFTREQVFDLAADIERYPDFLPGYITAQIQKRESNTFYVDQVVGFGPVRVQFSSKAVLRRPERIDVTSFDAPFRRFSLSWVVEAGPPPSCRVSLVAELELRSKLLQLAIDRALPATIAGAIAAFEARARDLYTVQEESLDHQPPRK